MLIDPPSPFAPEEEQRAFLAHFDGAPEDPEVMEMVRTVRRQLKERLFDPATYQKG